MLGVDELVHLTNELVQVDALTRNLCHAVFRPEQARRGLALVELRSCQRVLELLRTVRHQVHAAVEHHIIIFIIKAWLEVIDLVSLVTDLIQVHERVKAQHLLLRRGWLLISMAFTVGDFARTPRAGWLVLLVKRLEHPVCLDFATGVGNVINHGQVFIALPVCGGTVRVGCESC